MSDCSHPDFGLIFEGHEIECVYCKARWVPVAEVERLRTLLRRCYGALLTAGGDDTAIGRELLGEFDASSGPPPSVNQQVADALGVPKSEVDDVAADRPARPGKGVNDG